MAKHFYETLLEKNYDLKEEISNIEKLLRNDDYTGSLYNQIRRKFINWDKRNNYIELDKMMEKTGIFDIINKAKNKDRSITIDDFITYAEFIYNFLFSNLLESSNNFILPIIDNINNVLESINFESKVIKDKGMIIIIPRDYKVEISADIVAETDLNIAEKIYLYTHKDLKGNIFEKAIILSRLYMYFEKNVDKKLINNNFNTLSSRIGELSNSLKVRHAPKEKNEIILTSISDEVLENWYDILFKLYLTAIVISDYIDLKLDVDEIKKKINS